jgi:hypothetical protein
MPIYRRIVMPLLEFSIIETRKVLPFGYSGLSFGKYLEPGSFLREFTPISARAKG